MMHAAQAQGAELRLGQVTGVVRGSGGASVNGVEVDGETIEGDAVVIAMGLVDPCRRLAATAGGLRP